MLTRLPILMYHRVAPDTSGPLAQLTVPTEQFARQMSWLKRRGYRTPRQSELALWLEERIDLPSRSVVITFDDGYADNAIHAFPLLISLGLEAVTFIVTGLIGHESRWDRTADHPGHRLMDEAEIREWANQGLEFGAHGRSHCSLKNLPPERLQDEIGGSRDDLAILIGQPPVAFCYPYGDRDHFAEQAAARHFRLAYGVTEGVNLPTANPFGLHRTMILPNEPAWEFPLQMRLGFGPCNRARHGAVMLYRRLARRT